MKSAFKIIISAMVAAVMASVSCQKVNPVQKPNEDPTVNEGQSAKEERVITVSFTPQTKTTLDGLQPKFSNGDKILIANGQDTPDTCLVSVSGGVATITTKLAGPLTAVYPAKAAKMDENNENEITGVFVSTVQDGTFASANICMAENIVTEAVFHNKTAVFRINTPTENTPKYVEVITAGPQIANKASGEYTKLNKIHVATTSADAVYVSILVPTGLKVRDLSFADGHNIKTAKDNTTAIAVNTLSTVSSTGWDTPYVEIEMTVNSVTKKYKWATMNIGATEATEANPYGTYFSWGEVAGHTPSAYTTGSTFTFPSTKPEDPRYTGAWSYGSGFADCNTPFYNGSSYGKYTGTSGDGKTVLDLADDAANANLGGSWRMPTKEEFDALCSLSSIEWKSNYNDSGVNGYLFTDGSNSIFLPAAGYGFGTDLRDVGDYGYYWSSSLYTDSPYYAYFLYFFYDGSAYTDYLSRYYGQSVRALSE